jgi:hypothetical protein
VATGACGLADTPAVAKLSATIPANTARARRSMVFTLPGHGAIYTCPEIPTTRYMAQL